MKTRTVLTSAVMPIVWLLGFWILLHDSKPVRTLTAELAQRHLDAQGFSTLLVIGLWLRYPISFAWRAACVLSNSRSLLQDGQVTRGVVTRVSRPRRGWNIAFTFSNEVGVVFRANFQAPIDARP